MPENIAAQGGQSQITLFETIAENGKETLDLSKVNELNYYESILEHTIRVSATIADTGYRAQKKSGNASAAKSEDIDGRFVNLKIIDGYQNQLRFTDESKLRISLTRDIQESTNKSFFTIDLTSKEYDDNPKLKCAVIKRYDGKIDESIKKILTECIKTQKQIDADPTLNTFSVFGKSQTPFYLCTWLATRSVPEMQGANQNLAGYFFYETAEGYKFKSIDKLFTQKPKRILIFNNVIGSIPPGYDGKIIDYSFDKTFNLKQLRQTGALGQTQLRAFNIFSNKYEESEFNYKKQYQETNTGGTKPIDYGEDQDETTRRFFSIKDFGVAPSGTTKQQLEKSRDTLNFNIDNILRQSTMRYNALYTIKLSIVIAGDISLHAGDLIHCDFPEVSGEKLKVVNSEKSGIYMIHDLCHRITKNGCYTKLNLVRDSIGRKPF